MEFTGKLKGKVAVVAGATRGAGRGIACMLGEAGATVYCTGRSMRGKPATKNRPETIEQTAEMVTARGGKGIPVQVDHTDPEQVKALFERVGQEQNSRLDILVNDLTGDANMEFKPFLEHSLEKGLKMIENGSLSHLITSHFGIPLLLEKGGLVVEVTDGISDDIREFNFYYDLEKAINIRLARSLALQFRAHKIAVVALTPGFLRSEEMLDNFGVTEENWREGIRRDRFFAYSETPFYIGKAVVALACDRKIMRRSGQALLSGKLAREYGFTDMDGTQPRSDNQPNQSAHEGAADVDQVVVQPSQAADLLCSRAAGMQGVLFGFLVTLRAAVNGLQGGAEQGIEQGAGKSSQGDKKEERQGGWKNSARNSAGSQEGAQDSDEGCSAQGGEGAEKRDGA
jgi:NAD(P)-dependent dehydrogenase (short-subunit alcohol dehydrogenase family)